MRLNNIANFKRKVFLFSRDDEGKLQITNDDSFYPFYYEPDVNGEFVSYDGIALKQVIVPEPSDINNQRSGQSYSSDIKFVNNYMIHKIDKIEPCPLKYLFLDIEILAPKEFPEPTKAKYPISCITVYNSENKEYVTWWLPDYKDEGSMLDDFCFYVHGEAPDLLLAWNINFDYTYLHNRITDFPKKISPVGFSRYGEGDNIYFPAGISVVDYLTLFKKVKMREASYALDYIARTKLNEEPWPKTDFGEMSELVKQKNINDVRRMVELEKKYNLLPYYDELRRLTKVSWEDLYFNSRIVEMLLLEEAKLKNLILPNRKEVKEETFFQGATRESERLGAAFDIGKFDLTSAYPSMIVNFGLDTQNLEPGETEDNVNINGVYFRQNEEALLPSAVKKILVLKNNLKKEVKKDPSLKFKYDAIKGVVNSTFGVMGNKYFRLYDKSIAGSITYLVRDLIHYTKTRLLEEGIEVIYWDTDSVFTTTHEDISDKLNVYIQEWGQRYGKKTVDLQYEYEGFFSSIFFLGKCHYYGFIDGKTDPEIKGVEITRNSSSKYEAYFQEELLKKMLESRTPDPQKIIDWIALEKERIKTLPVEEVAFPAKIGHNKVYKNIPIFVRAYELTKKIKPDFFLNTGELFYYIFVKPIGYHDDVLAFKHDDKVFKDWSKHINWKPIIKRNIINKAETIFYAQGWDDWVYKLVNQDQLGLF